MDEIDLKLLRLLQKVMTDIGRLEGNTQENWQRELMAGRAKSLMR